MAPYALIWAGLRRLVHDQDGPTGVEYAVLLALVVFALIGTITGLSHAMQQVFTAATDALTLAPG
jgi:Flp pilus assembly pilin Flp